ncbi:MAG: hypothetical protein ACE37F_06535 [Nannocystaceae bacterium]|nr:hypothetical protein [bacterium]
MTTPVSEATQSTASKSVETRLAAKFDAMLDKLSGAQPLARSVHQTDVFQLAEALMDSEAGLRVLASRAGRFDEAGVFEGGPWADPGRLQPPLVAGSLKATGVFPVVETLSELRVLAIARGDSTNESMSQDDARRFLNDIMALNLDLVFPRGTEEERISAGPHHASNLRLFALIVEEIGLEALRREVIEEVDQICAQRPIMTGGIRRMVEMADRIPTDDEAGYDALDTYARALTGPTPMTREPHTLGQYREALLGGDPTEIETEARAFADSMETTGLVSRQHAVLLRHLRATRPELLPVALHLNEVGRAEFEQNREFALRLLKVAIVPSTAQSIYGFAKVLARGLLSRTEIQGGLDRLVNLDLMSDVRKTLLRQRAKRDGVTANTLLVAGALSVLGQPLGIGQGNNPTCQAARGLSLWAQHAPGYLLELLVAAARDGTVHMRFGDEVIESDKVTTAAVRPFDTDLDAVSLILVPHLDRIYEEMMRRVALRTEDGHKWVNPGLYGRWVPKGFASAFSDISQTAVDSFEDFVRRFFATHHPSYNDGHRLMYPNPVGLCVTNGHGDYLGPHAVSLQRIEVDPEGHVRAYFFNPNNEGRQDWGHGVVPSIRSHGEEEGESSLPFAQFVSRLYAFHYNPYEEGDSYAVPDAVVEEIEEAARNSWGRAFKWQAT